VFIDFTGYTCTNCRWMEANVFSKPEVDSLLGQFVLVKLYTDGDGAVYEQNQKFEETRFGTIALPMYAVMSAQDQTVAVFSKGMTRNIAEFATFLKSGLAQRMLAEK
jgi:thiol:disulfide interchange protein DsbD